MLTRNKDISESKVFVGLSGGVDSAVSAALLQKQGYDVTGVFIRIVIPGYPCTAGRDRIEAIRVATHLDIPFVEIDLSEEYTNKVFSTTISEYARGRTPNPDTLCNREIKFGLFYNFARERGADYIATGHYARTVSAGEEYQLHEGVDPEKDQSYFLWMVPEAHLRQTLFPVGNLHKAQVRALAATFHLPNALRRDSQGLCFLGTMEMDNMIQRELPQKPGRVLDQEGTAVGTHQGAALYTLGQRHGFSVTASTPHYVIAKNIEENTITVSPTKEPQGFDETEITLIEQNWIGGVQNGACEARFRYHGKRIPAVIDRKRGVVVLYEAHFVPIGQSLVLYADSRCLGGGIIDKAVLHKKS